MGFEFLSPLYLVGLAAALIPLIIHLSRSRRTKKMRFSTTRFFTEQFLRSYRMSKLKELLLLACRMALFALLAMALARPLFKTRGGGLAAGSGPRAVVLVLDDSASMAYAEGGVSLFRQAQEAASTVLKSLAPEDTVSVVLAGRRAAGPEVLFPEPISEHDEVQRAIDRVKVKPLGTDLSGAIRAAEDLAAGSRASGKSVAVYVFSDMQESGWDLPPRETIRSDATHTTFVFVAIKPKKAPVNRAVTAVRYAATRPRAGVPFALRPLLSLGADDGKDVEVRLVVDGARVAQQKVERLPGGKWSTPRFYHTFGEGGWHSGYVEVDDNVLPFDNRRYFALEVHTTTTTAHILAVNGSPSEVPHQDELFFLRFALTAVPEGQKEPFQLRAVGAAEVAGADQDRFPLVILANVERLSEQAVEKLEDYVAGGGKLLVFLGDKVNPGFYNDTLAGAGRRHGGLLPGRLGDIKDRKKGDPAGFISAVNYEHGALAAFQEPKLGTLLGPSLTFGAWPVTAPAGAVLMKSSKGLPLLLEKSFGKGQVLLFTSTCDRDWSDFPIRPGFLLWSRFLVEYLTQAPLSLQAGHATGDAVRLEAPSDDKGPLWVRKPSGEKVVVPRASDGSGAYELTDTVAPGIYTVLRSDQETRLGLFAVNVENVESDLTYLDDDRSAEQVTEEIRSRLGRPPLVSYVEGPGSLPDLAGGGGWSRELWHLVLVLVLLVGLFEPWLANQISARLYGKRPASPALAGAGQPRVAVAGARQPVEGGAR
jgi:hypothetical protein